MRNPNLYLPLILLMSCTQGDDDAPNDTQASQDSGTVETGDTAPTGPMVSGSLEMRDPELGLSAEVELWRAFSYFTDDATLIYATNRQDVECKDVATMLIGKKEVDPNDIFMNNTCNLLIQSTFKPNRDNYDIQTDEGGIASVYCTFGDGEWEWREDWKGERWYWSGDYYTAPAWKGTFSLKESQDRSITSTIELREFEGTFPLDETGSTEEHKASGKLTGTLQTEDCEKLNKTAWF